MPFQVEQARARKKVCSAGGSLTSIMSKKLEVTVTAANVKRLDTKAYNVTSREAWVKLVIGDQEKSTTRVAAPTLDPVIEQTFEFDVKDPETDKLTATFYLGDVMIGQPADYLLNGLIQKKLTYKGMAVPGGKVDLSLRALDFGKEEEKKEASDDSFFDFLGD